MRIYWFEKVRNFHYGVINKNKYVHVCDKYGNTICFILYGDLRGSKRSKTIEPENPRAHNSTFFYRNNRDLFFWVCELLSHK
jgi:hypothetical protein